MAIKNLIHGTFPPVVHCSGRTLEKNRKSVILMNCLRSLPNLRIKCPPSLSLATWDSRPTASPLEQQCKKEGLHLDVLGRGVEAWKNGMKGPLLIEFAKKVKTEFILAMDAYDVMIQGDLSACVRELKERGCDALFGGEVVSYPKDERCSAFEESKYAAPWRYLNSGLMVARTEFIASLRSDIYWDSSDQRTWRDLHIILWPKIKVDDRCRAFQNTNCATGHEDDPDRFFAVVLVRASAMDEANGYVRP